MLALLVIFAVKDQTDTLVAGFFLGAADLGAYAAARKLTGLIGFGLLAINSIAAPLIAELHAQGRRQELQRMITRASQGLFIFTLPVGGVVLIWGREILGLFGAEFVKSYTALAVLVVGQVVTSLTGPVGHLMVMTGHQRPAALIAAGAAALNLILNAVLIPHWGLTGAGLAATTTALSWNAAMYVYVRSRLEVDSLAFFLPRKASGRE
jgi:O-antigen/teichoic acid export membrane protein